MTDMELIQSIEWFVVGLQRENPDCQTEYERLLSLLEGCGEGMVEFGPWVRHALSLNFYHY
jgi:hypothetical protein